MGELGRGTLGWASAVTHASHAIDGNRPADEVTLGVLGTYIPSHYIGNLYTHGAKRHRMHPSSTPNGPHPIPYVTLPTVPVEPVLPHPIRLHQTQSCPDSAQTEHGTIPPSALPPPTAVHPRPNPSSCSTWLQAWHRALTRTSCSIASPGRGCISEVEVARASVIGPWARPIAQTTLTLELPSPRDAATPCGTAIPGLPGRLPWPSPPSQTLASALRGQAARRVAAIESRRGPPMALWPFSPSDRANAILRCSLSMSFHSSSPRPPRILRAYLS